MSDNTSKRKRGRPKKAQQSNAQDSKKTKSSDEPIILELNINEDDLERLLPDYKKAPVSAKKPSERETNKSNSIFTIEELSTSSPVYGKSSLNNMMERNFELEEKNKEIEKLKKIIRDYGMLEMNNTKAREINLDLIDNKTGNPIVVEKTKIACWWDGHQFDGTPCFLPEKYLNGKYHVLGCFCSFNCAAAYNFKCLNDYRVWDRYSLIQKLCGEITGELGEVLSAPPKEILKKYGGPLSIKEYRRSFKMCLREYRIAIPPMVTIVPLIEERTIDGTTRKKYSSTSKSNFDGLRLKRSKPLPSMQNTLLDTLGVRMR